MKSSKLSSASTTLALTQDLNQDPNGGDGGIQYCAEYTYCDCSSAGVTGKYPIMTGSTTIPSQTWGGSSCSPTQHNYTQAITSTPKRLDRIQYILILLWLTAPPLTLHQCRGAWPHIAPDLPIWVLPLKHKAGSAQAACLPLAVFVTEGGDCGINEFGRSHWVSFDCPMNWSPPGDSRTGQPGDLWASFRDR